MHGMGCVAVFVGRHHQAGTACIACFFVRGMLPNCMHYRLRLLMLVPVAVEWFFVVWSEL
jgi:hypothetical protein